MGAVKPKPPMAGADPLPDNSAMPSLEDAISGTHGVVDEYDVLFKGLAEGRFGGLPNSGNGAAAIVTALRRCDWAINFRDFAAAIPHFAEDLDLNDVRSALRHLGFDTTVDRVRGAHLDALPEGSFVVLRNGEIAFVTHDHKDRLILWNPATDATRRVWSHKTYQCFLVTAVDQPVPRKSWILATFNRFSRENRLIFVITFLSNALVVIASLSVGFIFDKVLPAQALDTLGALLIGIGFLLYIDLRLRRIKSEVFARVSGRLEYIVGSTMFERLMSFPLEMLTASSVSDQVNRLKQFETVRDFYAGPVVAVVFELPFVLVLLVLMFLLDPVIGLTLLGFIGLYGLTALVFLPRISRASTAIGGLRNECQRLQEETLGQRDQIINRGLGRAWTARITPRFVALSEARQKLDRIWRTLNSLVAVATPITVGAVILVGATRVMDGQMTGGMLIACTIMSTRLLNPVQQALLLLVRVPEVLNMFRQIDAMMLLQGRGNVRKENDVTPFHIIRGAPDIIVDNLVLRYPRSMTTALRGVNLKFDAGSFNCVTGAAGAGKSSLLRAIMGHYPAQNGTIMIGHSNIDQLSPRDRANIIGYLGHQSLQIHGTIAQNLRLTKPEATDRELHEIADELGILGRIEAAEDGFETRFSHADRQRFSPSFRTKFAIAQLLLPVPQILLLDEPESGLAVTEEEAILQAIKSRSGKMTCLMVTHRPSIAKCADKVVVMQAGQVGFFGPPTGSK